MYCKLARFWAVCLVALVATPATAQILTAINPQLPAKQPAPRMDPLVRAARVRAEIARLGLPPLGRGHIPQNVLLKMNRVMPGQFNVKFKPGVARDAINRLHRSAAARLVSNIPQLGIQTISLRDGAVALYKNNPNVLWIEPDPMRYPLVADPNEPRYNFIDYDMSFDGTWGTWSKWDAHTIQAVDAWTIWPGQYFTSAGGKGTASVTIAIIDTGIDETHEDFKNAGGSSTNAALGGQLLLAKNVTIFGGTTTAGAHDEFGHGTHVTGIAAAATNNGIGTTGNGYNAQVINIRVTDANGNGTSSDLAKAIIYAADNGAVVANCSLGDYTYSQAEQDAVVYAWNKGMLFVAAAGNDGADTAVQPVYPAALTRVLGVSATTWDDNLASYSDFGDAVGIGAPGGDLDFNFLALVGVYSTTPQYTVTLNDPSYGVQMNYDYLMGTSMASPEVVGAAALYAGMKGWRSATPGAPLKIWQALQQGADQIPGFDAWTPYFGYGRLNMYNTMNLAAVPNPRGDTLGGFLGQVRYKGTPVQNANIVALPAGGGSDSSSSSRSDGGYRIPNIAPGLYNVTATYFGESQTISNVNILVGCDTPGVDFNIGTAQLANVSLNPSSVTAGSNSTGTVTLTSPAPTGGFTVALSSSNANVAKPTVASILVPAGSTTKDFTVSTSAVTANTNVTISGTAAGITKSAVVTVTPFTALRINSGGPAYNGTAGAFIADNYFTGASAIVRTFRTITNTSDPTLYLTLRGGNSAFSYNIAVPDGNYQVNLHFAETGYTSANQRKFNVSLNGIAALTNFDVFVAAGNAANKAVVKLFNVVSSSANNGVIAINFTPVLSGAFVNAIEVIATAPQPPPAPTGLTASPGNGQVSLAWNASSGATSYNVKRSTTSGSGYVTINSPTTTSFLDTGRTNGTTYYYVVSASNSVGEGPNSAEVSATPTNVAPVRVNCGGPAYNGTIGAFLADAYFSGGSAIVRTNRTITNTSDPTLYLTLRGGNSTFLYNIPVVQGNYNVNLHFAETGWTAAGQRKFNVTVNGTQVLTNFDVFAAAGAGNKAIIKTFPVTITSANNGILPIVFIPVLSGPFINAIEVVPAP